MKLLLDTNVFIWLNDAPHRVRSQVISIIANPDIDLLLEFDEYLGNANQNPTWKITIE